MSIGQLGKLEPGSFYHQVRKPSVFFLAFGYYKKEDRNEHDQNKSLLRLPEKSGLQHASIGLGLLPLGAERAAMVFAIYPDNGF
jgi:hypothetical protein